MVDRFCLMCSDLKRAAENRYIIAHHLFIDWWLWLEDILIRVHSDKALAVVIGREGYRVRFGQVPYATGEEETK